MRILCTENQPGAADQAVDQLGADGHGVLVCFERGAPASAPVCVGLDRCGGCPLDDSRGVDAVLAVRAEGHAHQALRGAGVSVIRVSISCAD